MLTRTASTVSLIRATFSYRTHSPCQIVAHSRRSHDFPGQRMHDMTLPVAAHPPSRRTLIFQVLLLILSSAQLVILKSTIVIFPHPSTVFLVHLAINTFLGFLRYVHYTGLRAEAPSVSDRLCISFSLAVSSMLAQVACIYGFSQGINVDTLVALCTCTSIAVTAANVLFINSNEELESLTYVVLAVAAAAFNIHVAAVPPLGLLCLLAWFVSTTFHTICYCHCLTAFNDNSNMQMVTCLSLSMLACLLMFLLCDWWSVLALTALSLESGSLLALWCTVTFSLEYVTRESHSDTFNNTTTIDHSVLDICSKLFGLLINFVVWDKHNGFLANALTATALGVAFFRQREKSSIKGSSTPHEALPNPASRTAGICVVAAAVASLVMMAGVVGTTLVREGEIMLSSNIRFLGFASPHSLEGTHTKLASISGKAVDWESMLATKHVPVTGPAAVGPDVGQGTDSGVIAVLDDRRSLPGSTLAASRVPQIPHAEYLNRLKAVASKPINVAIMNEVWWPVDPQYNCSLNGVPLDCRFSRDQAGVDFADALYYHLPTYSGRPRAKAFANQLRLAVSLESGQLYGNVDDPKFMCSFDAEVTYRQCAQAVHYYAYQIIKDIFTKPVPFEGKKHAVVYINSNCGNTPSNRTLIMKELISLNGSVPVHSLGNCDRNMPWPPGNPGKREVQRGYKFCIAMENSVSPDYVTEKLWDGLIAGCIPVYMGASVAVDMVPDRRGIILYDPAGKGDASTPLELANLLHTISNNKIVYESMMHWKYIKAEDQPNALFKNLWAMQTLSLECVMCRFLAQHKIDPKPRYTTCLFNTSWTSSNGRPAINMSDPDISTCVKR